MATISACTHSPWLTAPGEGRRQSSGRLSPVAIPALAERYWMSIAMALLTISTHTSR